MSNIGMSYTEIPIIEEKAIAYIRVSTIEQQKKGFSFKSQLSMAEKYIMEYNARIRSESRVYKYDDLKLISEDFEVVREAKSASNNIDNDKDIYTSLKTRPELQRILDLAQQKRFKHLIVLSHDRLARNFEQFIILKRMLEKNNIKIHYSRPGESLETGNDKIGRFLDNILASVAELESNILGMRVKAGCSTCIQSGYWPGGRIPYGCKSVKTKESKRKRERSSLVVDPEEGKHVSEVFELYYKGLGYRKIAENMNNKYNVNIWTKSKVEKIINNETYTGRITWNRRFNPQKYSADTDKKYSAFKEELKIVDMKVWEDINAIKNRKNDIKDPYYYITKFILKDKLFCTICNKPLATRNYGKNASGNEYCIYRCNSNSSKESHFAFKQEEIENEVLDHLCNCTELKEYDEFWNIYCKKVKDMMAAKSRYKKNLEDKIKSIDGQIKALHSINDYFNNIVEQPLNEQQSDDDSKIKKLIEKKVQIKGKLNIKDFLLNQTKVKYEKEKEELIAFMDSYKAYNREEFNNEIKGLIKRIVESDDLSKRKYIDILVDRINLSLDEKTGEIKKEYILNTSLII
jgi:site-specific DNA recombinase